MLLGFALGVRAWALVFFIFHVFSVLLGISGTFDCLFVFGAFFCDFLELLLFDFSGFPSLFDFLFLIVTFRDFS